MIARKNLPTRRIAGSLLKNKARDIPFGFEGNEESFVSFHRQKEGWKVKGKGLAAAVMIACLLTGCVRYDGSRIGNESQLSMEYRVFNGSDQQELSLKAGDIMQGSVERRKGSLRIRLCRQGEKEPVFEMENPASGSFSVEIEENGRYILYIEGKGAAGSFQFIKEE